MSRASQRSLVTNRSADKSGGSSMKCIVTVGIILPLLAAIIGVAAWSVSSDSVHRRSPPSSVYHGGRSYYRNGDHVFEERNDNEDLLFGQKVPIGGAVSKDVLGPDVEEERDILPPVTDVPPERDPLYVVHYVPRGPQEATSQPPAPSASPDVLSKILQAGKGTGKGTPQFVVFAPMAGEGEDADDRSMQASRKRNRKRKKMRKEYDYEDEYPETTQQVRQQMRAIPREGYDGDYQQNGQGWTQNLNANPQQQQPCCNMAQGGGGGGGGMMMMPPQGGGGGGMMSTEAPSKGITITVGQGLPLGPLGILRQILRPKVDLRKKLFFGVQLENGIGFGGNNNGGGQMSGGGQMGSGNMGQMGGGGSMGQMGGGGGMGQQGGGGGGGITYTFG